MSCFLFWALIRWHAFAGKSLCQERGHVVDEILICSHYLFCNIIRNLQWRLYCDLYFVIQDQNWIVCFDSSVICMNTCRLLVDLKNEVVKQTSRGRRNSFYIVNSCLVLAKTCFITGATEVEVHQHITGNVCTLFLYYSCVYYSIILICTF